MSELFLTCDKCHAHVPVEPLETFGYRSVSCKECGAELVFLNAELKTRPAARTAPGVLNEEWTPTAPSPGAQ